MSVQQSQGLRKLFEPQFLMPLRLLTQAAETFAEVRRVRSASDRLGFPMLTDAVLDSELAFGRSGGKLFILGTGASVMNLTTSQFDHVAQHTSVGVNNWLLHEFIPDFYAYECDENPSFFRSFERPAVIEQQPPLLIIRPSRDQEYEVLEHLPVWAKQRAFIYGRTNVWTKAEKNVGADYLASIRFASKLQAPKVLVDNGASIVRMLSLGIERGFREIIFVGVDLQGQHFWQQDPSYLSNLDISDYLGYADVGRHATTESRTRPFGVDRFLAAVAKIAYVRNGVRLSVASADSLLSSFLPVYNWDPLAS